MRVLIVENTRHSPHGQLGVALNEAAAAIEIVRPWMGEALPLRPAADALVVLGGEQAATDDHSHPYLPQLAALMAAYAAADRPVLGICLGSQILARAFGARNHVGTAREFGWCEVALTGEGQADPVLGHRPATFPIFQWHADTFSLPAGAVRLAGSATVANQAFRIGRATYGTQFHFEASRAVARHWHAAFGAMMESARPGWTADFAAEAAAWGAAADAHGLAIARAWVGLI